MNIQIDVQKAKTAIPILFKNHPAESDSPAASEKDILKGSAEHALVLTLAALIMDLEKGFALRKHPTTAFLINPEAVVAADRQSLNDLLREEELPATAWQTICTTFHNKWGSDPRRFLADCSYNAQIIFSRLQNDRHQEEGRWREDFPLLRNSRNAGYWLRLLREEAEMTMLRNLDQISIPMDIHIARASLHLGVVKGVFEGPVEALFEIIGKAWAEGLHALEPGDQAIIPLDLEQPLFDLGSQKCSQCDPETGECLVRDSCTIGRLCVPGSIQIRGDRVYLNT